MVDSVILLIVYLDQEVQGSNPSITKKKEWVCFLFFVCVLFITNGLFHVQYKMTLLDCFIKNMYKQYYLLALNL